METSLQEDPRSAAGNPGQSIAIHRLNERNERKPANTSVSSGWPARERVIWFTSDEPLARPGGNQTIAYLIAQRLIDVIGALSIGLLASPVIVATFLVLLVTTKGRPLFSQERVGFCGRRFRMYKFRSMTLDADALQHLVGNEMCGPAFKNRRDPRITRIGRWLRKTSIDELPQLWNVLWGDMSLVGPRPLPTREIARCTDRQLQRLAVKPGLTCRWQVSGRNDVGFDEWIEMDLWYVANQSVQTDLALLLKTPWCVLTGRGAY
ncbi:MAG: sugar transferase [Planctomycetes bacterium]|nr:sugar transferase [Planctomycetota bacterium]